MGPKRDQWVCLDVGETLIDETRVWTTWAAILDVPAFTLMAAIGAVVASAREDHQRAFEMVGRADWRLHLPEFRDRYGRFRADDLYPDAASSLNQLRSQGFRVAILANQPPERTVELRALGIDAEVMAMSGEMGLSKPDSLFFQRGLEMMGRAHPADVAYVGDRLDNDVRPAIGAGMRAVWLRRGPWGAIGDAAGPPAETALIVRSLSDLAARVQEAWPEVATLARG